MLLTAGLLFMLYGCSGGGSGSGTVAVSANNGAVAAQLVWPSASAAAVKSAVLPATVVTVRITITGPDREPVSGSFPAAAGQGSVAGVPAGSGLTVTAEGLDASNEVVYSGNASNITVTAGPQPTDVTITMSSSSAGMGDVTITGTVAGTSFVAVEASSASVVARQTATVKSDGSKVFSIRIQSGRQYKFYLIENEGTLYERVFALYFGNGNRVLVRAGTCDLGFVSTTGNGIAVPDITPPQFTGPVDDPTVPTNVSKNAYAQADLAGTWYMFQLHSGTSPYYRYGTVQVDANGIVTTLPPAYSSNDSIINYGTTQITISTSGIIWENNGNSRLVMSRDKNLIVGGSYSGSPRMMILVRASSDVTQGNLAGTWKMHSLDAGPNYRNWSRSDITIDASGNSTQSNRMRNSGPASPSEPFVLNVTPTGLLSATRPGSPLTLHGALTPDKNLVVLAYRNSDGSVALGLLVRTGGTNFSPADIVGSWRSNWLTLGPYGDFWGRALAVVDSNGYSLSYDRVVNGESREDRYSNSRLEITNTGLVFGMSGNGQGIVSLTKDLFISTQSDTINPNYSTLNVVMK